MTKDWLIRNKSFQIKLMNEKINPAKIKKGTRIFIIFNYNTINRIVHHSNLINKVFSTAGIHKYSFVYEIYPKFIIKLFYT